MPFTLLKINWLEALHPRHLLDPTTLCLLSANLIPLAGVFWWHWDLFLLMMVYWMETGVIGFWNILRMAIEARWFALFLVPFFCLHFGGFMFGHFVVLLGLFGKDWHQKIHGPGDVIQVLFFGAGLWIPVLALFVSHGISFLLNFLNPFFARKRKPLFSKQDGAPQQPLPEKFRDRALEINEIMKAPYRRIFILHLTLIFGAVLTVIFQTKTAAYVLLILIKIIVDTASHARKNFMDGFFNQD